LFPWGQLCTAEWLSVCLLGAETKVASQAYSIHADML